MQYRDIKPNDMIGSSVVKTTSHGTFHGREVVTIETYNGGHATHDADETVPVPVRPFTLPRPAGLLTTTHRKKDNDMTNEITEAAEKLGRERGHAAATWATDGNTEDETYRRLLQGIEDGDPEIMDMMPAPLEWTGESIPELIEQSLLDRYEVVGDDRDAWCDAYEEAFSDAYWNELERTCRYHID